MAPRKKKSNSSKLTDLDQAIVSHGKSNSSKLTDEMSLGSKPAIPATGGAEITGEQLAGGGIPYSEGDPELNARDAQKARERDEAEEEQIAASRG